MVAMPPVIVNVDHELEGTSSLENVKVFQNEDAPPVGQQANEYDRVESVVSVSRTSVSEEPIRSRVDVVTGVTSEHVFSEKEEIVAQQGKTKEELESQVEGQLQSGEEDKQAVITAVDAADKLVDTNVERDSNSSNEGILEDQAAALSSSQDHRLVASSSYLALDHGEEDKEDLGEEFPQVEEHSVSAREQGSDDSQSDMYMKHESLAEGGKDEEEVSVSAEGQVESNQTSSKLKHESLAIEVS